MHELDTRGEDVLDPVPVDGVRVTPAHLHELEVVFTRELADARDEPACGGGSPVLVDEAHAPSYAIRLSCAGSVGSCSRSASIPRP